MTVTGKLSRVVRLVAALLASLLTASVAHAGRPREPWQEARRLREVERERAYVRAAEAAPAAERRASPPAARTLPADADDDGMADSWETGHGLDPGNPNDAWLDPDGDHVINLFEYQLGSSISNAAAPPYVTVGATGATYTNVEEALDAVAPGTVLRVAGGTYRVNYLTFDSVVVMIQGGWSPDFTSRSLKLYPTVFDGNREDEILYFTTSTGSPVVILEGIRFIRGGGYFGAINLLASGDTSMRTSLLNCTLQEGRVYDAFTCGGISMNNWDTSESDRTLANVLIARNEGPAIKAGITDSNTVARWRILNCALAYNVGTSGLARAAIDAYTLDTGALTARVGNSILWGVETNDLCVDIRRNMAFTADHSDVGKVDARSGAVFSRGAGMLSVAPGFVAPAGGDFHLRAGSSLVDAGASRGAPATDFEGDPRPWGATVDIGADEITVNPDDTDDDGLPDTWELEYFSSLTNMNASTDSDGDRFQDRHEYLAGTNPTNRESYLRMHAPGIGPGGAAPVLRWSSADGKRYTLERSSALSSGFPASVGSGLDASPPLNTVTDVTAAGAGPYFYRVKLAH